MKLEQGKKIITYTCTKCGKRSEIQIDVDKWPNELICEECNRLVIPDGFIDIV